MPLDIVRTEKKGESISLRLPLSIDKWVRDRAKREGVTPGQVLEACAKSAKEKGE